MWQNEGATNLIEVVQQGASYSAYELLKNLSLFKAWISLSGRKPRHIMGPYPTGTMSSSFEPVAV